MLADAGFPWYFDRPSNTYRFAEGYSLKRLDLSSHELFGLVALRSFGASIGGAIGQSIDEIADKLLGSSRGSKAHLDGASPVAFRLSEIRMDERGERAFALLSAAERVSRSVQFVYQDKEGATSARTIDPYGFIVSGGRIYCVGYDQARKDMRTFAVDNVDQVQTLARSFVRPSDFNVEEYAAASISGVMHSSDLTEVRVRFASRVAKAAMAARVVADRQIERHDDGSVEIAFRVADTDELIRWVLGWGAQAEVISPEDVRTRTGSLAREIAAKYGATTHVRALSGHT